MSNGAREFTKIKPSFVPYTWKGILTMVLGLAIFVFVFVVQLPVLFRLSSAPVLLAALVLVGLGFLMVLVGAVRRGMYTYQITDSQILIQKQLLSRSVRKIPFVALSDVEVSQTLFGRLAGYGNIAPISKSGYGLVRGADRTENLVAEMTNVPHPDRVANLIMSRVSLMPTAS
jgi:membrane protein YdbS with pleckstrin-like domain